jgi:hypothetical protein
MSLARVPGDNHAERERWIVGADSVIRRPRPAHTRPVGAGRRSPTSVPVGRLHAVGDAGLLAGRALCLAPVTLLDPAQWRWPDDADELRPLCWTCLALTHATEGPHTGG